ncbi:MAG: helix-turn-helix domain-containing protein [Desulfovibrio sp.]|jgi:DNA-binding MarR family transcriptional regulator|nr:helix-turn-helix domain-containing protein [Desulfovibrio sp.]
MSFDAICAVWDQKDLTTAQKIILFSIGYRANKNNTCWPSINRIMADTSIGDRHTVINAIKTLTEKGYIEVVKAEGRSNRYINQCQKYYQC